MLIPALMEKLNETDPTLGQPSGQQAIGGEGPGLFGIVSIKLEGGLILTAQIHDFWNRALHTKSHLVLGDPGGDFRIVFSRHLPLIPLLQSVEHATTLALADALGIVQVEHRIAPGTKGHSLMHRRQKPIAPKPGIKRLSSLVLGDQNAERRQVGVL